MKKFPIIALALLASFAGFAQVDSTTQSVDTTTMTSPSDSSSQAAITPDASTTVASADSLTDEDLKKYAIVMDSVDAMKQSLMTEISTKIKSNDKIKISRYNQLSKAVDDEAKLKELKATEEEIAFVKDVSTLKSDGAAKISETVESLAKDFVGVDKYNKIKDSLNTDTALKSRYDEIFSEVQSGEAASVRTSN